MLDINKLSSDIRRLKNQDDFGVYLESNFIEIEEYLINISYKEIETIKFDIEDLLYDMIDNKLVKKENNKTINAFLILLAEKFIQSSMIGCIVIIYDFIYDDSMRLRLDAAKLYLKVNDISKDYISRSAKILELLDESAKIDEYNTNAIKSLMCFLQASNLQFRRLNDEILAKELIDKILSLRAKFKFLDDIIIDDFFNSILKSNISHTLICIKNILEQLTTAKAVCKIKADIIKQESSAYAQKLLSLDDADFDVIRNIAFEYIKSIGDPDELYNRLQRGEAIIDDEKLLYKYLVSFGGKHKLKLYSAYDVVIEKLQNEKIDIIDWGCGQATATMLLLNYAREKNIKLDIENITLIEPSSLALSRGLLHVDILKQKDYNIKAINSDLDCLDAKQLASHSQNKTLHLFSNILDVESFILDTTFFKKVSHQFQNNAIFVCISPNRNDKLNNRIDLFYNYFDENFDIELLSSRNNDIGNSTRYEKIFEVKYIKSNKCHEAYQDIEVLKKNYNIDIIEELSYYEKILSPVLDIKLLENSINNDPEYVIFKIRKIAEVITTKIYAAYEDNANHISFNDKIRYLSYEKKIFNKTITNYIQTIRTIGNRGVHEDNRDNSKLKLDVHLMILALVSFLKEVTETKII